MSDPTLARPRDERFASKSDRRDAPARAEDHEPEVDPFPAPGERSELPPGETTDRVETPDLPTDADSAGGSRPPTLDSTDVLSEPATGAVGGESTLPIDASESGTSRPRAPDSIDPDAPLSEDDFDLLEPLGAGGMGEVFRALQKSLRKQVALKLLKREALDSPSRVRRFLAEARALARLRHPQIVGVHGIGRLTDGRYFLVMDLIEGGATLQALIRERPVDVERAVRLVATVAGAIEHAHGRGVIHRDLKPSNVLLDGRGEPHVTDFGLAKIFDAIDPDHPQTTADQILGTPHYMSPEQADPARGPVTPRTDVYGLGGILFALLTGRPPLEGDSITQILGQLVSPEPVRSPRELRRGVPPSIDAICRRCLHKDPALRYRSAREVAQALQDWLERSPPGDPDQASDAAVEVRPVTPRGEWLTDRSLKDHRQRRTDDYYWALPKSPARRSPARRLIRISSVFTLLALLVLGPYYLMNRSRPLSMGPTRPMAMPREAPKPELRDSSGQLSPLPPVPLEAPEITGIVVPLEIDSGARELPVRVMVASRDFAIKEVSFVLNLGARGEFTGSNVVPGKRTEGIPETWEATLPVSKGASGKLVISVRAVSNAGVAGFAHGEVTIRERTPEPSAAGSRAAVVKPGAVSGKVTENGIGQPGITVYLIDPKATDTSNPVKASAKTGVDGTFSFTDLQPGSYRIFCANEGTGRRESKDVVVPSGRTLEQDLELRLP